VTDPVLEKLLADRDGIIARLFDFVRQPSVGADPAYSEGMDGARHFLLERLRALGFRSVQSLDAGGQPAIYGEWLEAPDKPTFLVYGHYDVQPPDPVEKWASPPFEPTVRDGRIYARGVSDDKGPSLIALEALGAFLSTEGRLPVHVKILLEGEEETGSATFAALCRQFRELLSADAVISADGARWRADLPTVNVASRGNNGFEFAVTTGIKDLHSGRYGGAVPNALHVIADLIASFRDTCGAIVVEGFFDGLREPSADERAELAAIPFDEDAFYRGLDTAPAGEPGYTTLERLWLRPTLEVNGLWGGYTGAGGKTVIPNEAHAKLTTRLVPGQDPDRVEQAIKDHLLRHCPQGARITFSDMRGGSGAYSVPPDHPLLAAAEVALAETLHAKPIRVRMGATLPMTDIILRELGIHTVMFSFATSDEDYHAPNEFFRLSSLDEGLFAWVRLLRVLGVHDSRDYVEHRRAAA
jgi:acetylornithine deacetylase/succinyl-diaminopimelate desuccinylase-like protein